MMATRSRACGMFRNVYLAQGVAFSADSSVILVGNMVERNVQVLRWDGTSLTDRGADPGQRRLGGAPHRGPPIAAATTTNALPARREVRNVGKGKNMKKEKKKPKQKK